MPASTWLLGIALVGAVVIETRGATEARLRPSAIIAPHSSDDLAPPTREGRTPPEIDDPATVRPAADLDEPVEGSIASLDSDDPIVVAEVTDRLAAHGSIEAIASLIRIDVLARPDVAPGVIDALGRLGAAASGDPRDAALTRLLELLEREKHRGAAESPGNLLQIYESLGRLGDRRAAPALEAELADPTVGDAPKVVVVEALVASGAATSDGAIASLRARLVAEPETDAYRAEVRRDLVVVVDRALARRR